MCASCDEPRTTVTHRITWAQEVCTATGASFNTCGQWLTWNTRKQVCTDRVTRQQAKSPDTLAAAPLQMIVVSELLPNCYVAKREDADRRFSIHQPLLCFTVGLAGVIDETRHVPFMLCIDDFMRAAS